MSFMALRYEAPDWVPVGFFDTEDGARDALVSDGAILDWSTRSEVQVEEVAPTKTVVTPKDVDATRPEKVIDAEVAAAEALP